MRSSENLSELAKALSAFQGKIKSALRDSLNPFFKSPYADFTTIVETVKEELAKHGLSVTQGGKLLENGTWILITKLMHVSGQWIETEYPILSKDNSPQGFGSGNTYARRYSYQSILGITTDTDDDAEAAMGRNHHTTVDKKGQNNEKLGNTSVSRTHAPSPTLPPRQNAVAPKIEAPAAKSSLLGEVKERPITEAQVKRLYFITQKTGWTDKEVKDLVFSQYGKDSVRILNSVEYDKICQWIETTPPPASGMMEQF